MARERHVHAYNYDNKSRTPCPECIAARDIADALLEACEAIVWAHTALDEEEADYQFTKATDKAKAAIAKARGGRHDDESRA